jgi:hypothetical protein
MVEFYFILSAVNNKIGAGMFFRLFLGTVFMLASGYCGEAGFVPALCGFIAGMAGWGAILFEIFAGEAGKESGTIGGHVKTAFDTMKFIVTVGWSIYPLGYFFGYLMGSVDASTLNLVYNLADFVNKIAFCLAIWNCAKQDTIEREPWDRLDEKCRSASVSPKVEAARKLISNYQRVVTDVTNQSPKTQLELRRVSPDAAKHVGAMMREVARHLLELAPEENAEIGNFQQAGAWQMCAAYFAGRTQGTAQQCPGRAPDMSPEAAAAFNAALKEVASRTDGGKAQPLLP